MYMYKVTPPVTMEIITCSASNRDAPQQGIGNMPTAGSMHWFGFCTGMTGHCLGTSRTAKEGFDLPHPLSMKFSTSSASAGQVNSSTYLVLPEGILNGLCRMQELMLF